MGRESLYLMAFHIIGFFICNSIMVRLGFFSVSDTKCLYTFDMRNNGWFLLAYVISGVVSSFAIIYTFRSVKKTIVKDDRKIRCSLLLCRIYVWRDKAEKRKYYSNNTKNE